MMGRLCCSDSLNIKKINVDVVCKFLLYPSVETSILLNVQCTVKKEQFIFLYPLCELQL